MKWITILMGVSLLWSANALAEEQRYQADVEGMVCAFCAYSVSRDIAKLPGVDADSVDVDLENGLVTFSSAAPVAEDTLTGIFSSTGFRVTGLKKVAADAAATTDYQLALDLTINEKQLSTLQPVLESVGELAAARPSRMVLSAPAAYEDELLKPILMGRKQVMKVRFLASDEASIHLQLFLAENSD